MSTQSRIQGVRLKAERAKKHIRDVDSGIRTFCDSEPYTLGIEPKPQIQHVALYVSSVEPIPDEISLMIGDAVHNLRSSLDHLVWQLVEAGGGTPNKDTYFPICKSPQQYASAIGKGEINKMPIGAEKVLRSVQPYITGDDTLWHVHELDRIDKHRLVLTTAIALNCWSIVFGPGREITFPETPVPLERGYEVVNVPAPTYHRQAHKGFKLGLDVAFGQSEILAGKPILESLDKMAKFVDGVFARFKPFLV